MTAAGTRIAVVGEEEIPFLRILENARRFPDDACAIDSCGTVLTYRQLAAEATRLARHLARVAGADHALVGILLRRSPHMLVALLAVNMAGLAYVPLSLDNPKIRNGRILRDARIRVLISDAPTAQHAGELLADAGGDGQLVLMDAVAAELPPGAHRPTVTSRLHWGAESTAPLASTVSPEQINLVVYTSGSTGEPKGAIQRHNGYYNCLRAFQRIAPLRRGDRTAFTPAFSFDVGQFAILWTLFAGGTVCVFDEEASRNPWAMADRIRDLEVTHLHFVPSYFGEFTTALLGQGYSFPSLKAIFLGGEILQPGVVRNWRENFGSQAVLSNVYGPTECSIWSLWHRVEGDADADIPIGQPLDDVVAVVVDGNGQELPAGEVGELWIGGQGVGNGYLGDAQRTAQAFVSVRRPGGETAVFYRTGDLASRSGEGFLHFHGRADNQVKIRGFRVEIGEVEANVLQHPDVREVAVAAVELLGQKRLVGWYAPATVAPETLRAFLAQRVPDYFIPSRLVPLGSLPRNVNRKIDRQGLISLLGDVVPPPASTGL